MPSRRLPNSTPAVIRTLTAAKDAWTRFPTDRLITPEQFAQLDPAQPTSFLNRLLKEAGDVPLALATQAPLTSALSQSIARLTLYVSHFHQVYDLGVARGTFTAAGRAYYSRDLTATTLPDLTTIPGVLEAGARIPTGEAARQAGEAAAYTPMALPSAAQVAAVHADAAQKRAAAETAKLFTDTQEGELAVLYPEAQRLATSLLNTIEFRLNERPDLDAPGRRRIARAWGAVYVNEDGTEATDPPPADVPTI